MKKTIIRLTEQDLHSMIMEAVNEMIPPSELYSGKYADTPEEYYADQEEGKNQQEWMANRAERMHPQATELFNGPKEPRYARSFESYLYPNGAPEEAIERSHEYDKGDYGF